MLRYLICLIVLAIPAFAQVSTNRVILGDPPGGAGAACTAPATNIYLAASGLEYTCYMNVWSSVGSAGSGTVTSIAETFTGGLISVAGSPITTSGTFALTVAGTSGGVPYFSSGSTWASSAALTVNLPMVGGGAGNPPTVGTRSGNTTAFVTTTGTQTSGDCVKIDANGNHIANGSACGSGGTGDVVGPGSATDNAVARFDGTTGKLIQNSGVTIDDSDNISTPGSISTGVGSGVAGSWNCVEGTAAAAAANSSGFQCPTDVTSAFKFTLPAAPAAGVIHATNAAPSVMSVSAVVSADLNITTTTCTYPSVLTAISSSAVGTCTVPTIPQNSQSTAYTTVLGDAGKHILHPTADNNARTFTIDSNANVAYPVGTTITFVNQINTLTIAITSDTLQLAGTATTGSRTCAAGCVATALKVTTTLWLISGPGLT